MSSSSTGGDEKSLQEVMDYDRASKREMLRLSIITALAWAVAVAIPVGIAATGGESIRVPLVAFFLGLVAWTCTAVVWAWRSTSVSRVASIETYHLLVWAISVMALLFGTLAWMLAGPDSGQGITPLWYAHIAVLLLGWVGVHARGAHLSARQDLRDDPLA